MIWVEGDVCDLLSWWMVDGWKEKMRKVRMLQSGCLMALYAIPLSIPVVCRQILLANRRRCLLVLHRFLSLS